MAKLPKPPRGLPLKPRAPPPPPASRPQPLQYRPTVAKLTPKPSTLPPPSEGKNEALTGAKRVWEERPRVSDLRRLSPEEMQTSKHTMKVNRWRSWPVFVCGSMAFGMGLYGVQLYNSIANAPKMEDVSSDLPDRFDREAEGYDEKVGMAETLLLLNMRRKAITQRARGHVLEVAVGTGRNISYYPTKQCATVTLLDSSAPMLAVAKRKWKDTHPEYFSRVFFKQQSAIDPITPPYGAQDGYDTVIQTMGLCSTPEPVKLLQSLEAATKEDGQILLLEHGKSHYEWLNALLDKTAPAHLAEHGCLWNKDIGQIVEDSGLEVVKIQRYNFGTTWWIELRPRKGMRRNLTEAIVGENTAPQTPIPEAAVTQNQWFSLWR